jgi:hypothetical protein
VTKLLVGTVVETGTEMEAGGRLVAGVVNEVTVVDGNVLTVLVNVAAGVLNEEENVDVF